MAMSLVIILTAKMRRISQVSDQIIELIIDYLIKLAYFMPTPGYSKCRTIQSWDPSVKTMETCWE